MNNNRNNLNNQNNNPSLLSNISISKSCFYCNSSNTEFFNTKKEHLTCSKCMFKELSNESLLSDFRLIDNMKTWPEDKLSEVCEAYSADTHKFHTIRQKYNNNKNRNNQDSNFKFNLSEIKAKAENFIDEITEDIKFFEKESNIQESFSSLSKNLENFGNDKNSVIEYMNDKSETINRIVTICKLKSLYSRDIAEKMKEIQRKENMLNRMMCSSAEDKEIEKMRINITNNFSNLKIFVKKIKNKYEDKNVGIDAAIDKNIKNKTNASNSVLMNIDSEVNVVNQDNHVNHEEQNGEFELLKNITIESNTNNKINKNKGSIIADNIVNVNTANNTNTNTNTNNNIPISDIKIATQTNPNTDNIIPNNFYSNLDRNKIQNLNPNQNPNNNFTPITPIQNNNINNTTYHSNKAITSKFFDSIKYSHLIFLDNEDIIYLDTKCKTYKKSNLFEILKTENISLGKHFRYYNIGHSIFLCGGEIQNQLVKNCFIITIIENFDTPLIQPYEPMNKARHMHSMIHFKYNSENYIIAVSGNRTKTTEITKLESETWSMLSDLNNMRTKATCLAINDKIYVIGGFELNENNNIYSVEVLDFKAVISAYPCTNTIPWKLVKFHFPNTYNLFYRGMGILKIPNSSSFLLCGGESPKKETPKESPKKGTTKDNYKAEIQEDNEEWRLEPYGSLPENALFLNNSFFEGENGEYFAFDYSLKFLCYDDKGFNYL